MGHHADNPWRFLVVYAEINETQQIYNALKNLQTKRYRAFESQAKGFLDHVIQTCLLLFICTKYAGEAEDVATFATD